MPFLLQISTNYGLPFVCVRPITGPHRLTVHVVLRRAQLLFFSSSITPPLPGGCRTIPCVSFQHGAHQIAVFFIGENIVIAQLLQPRQRITVQSRHLRDISAARSASEALNTAEQRPDELPDGLSDSQVPKSALFFRCVLGFRFGGVHQRQAGALLLFQRLLPATQRLLPAPGSLRTAGRKAFRQPTELGIGSRNSFGYTQGFQRGIRHGRFLPDFGSLRRFRLQICTRDRLINFLPYFFSHSVTLFCIGPPTRECLRHSAP